MMISKKPRDFMIKIYLPNLDNKFFNNLRLFRDDNIQIYSGSTTNIYRTHANIIANIYIFDSSFITNEILQFILEHTDYGTKFFVYHDKNKLNKDCIRYLKQVKHLISDVNSDNSKNDNIITVPKFLINDKIYKQKYLQKINRKIYFLDSDESIPEAISSRLYPNSKENILMFNNAKISHYQNLGIVSEYDKAELLNSSEYFICNKNEDYVAEAFVCGCKIIDCKNFMPYESSTELSNNTLVTYTDFMKNTIL